MRMNSEPTRRRAPWLLAALPAVALVGSCSAGPSEELPATTSPITTTSEPAINTQLVFCDARPGDKVPSAGKGTSAYEFVLGNPTAPGRALARLTVTLEPVEPSAPPGSDMHTKYEWRFADDLTPSNPDAITNTAAVTVNGTTYAMGFTAIGVETPSPRVVSFCAPEGSPDIPPPTTI